MPKRRELEPWEQNLVSAIKEQHRFGYSVRPMRGKVQVQRFWSDTGKRETVTLPVAWEKGCQRDVLNGINAINDGLQKGPLLQAVIDGIDAIEDISLASLLPCNGEGDCLSLACVAPEPLNLNLAPHRPDAVAKAVLLLDRRYKVLLPGL